MSQTRAQSLVESATQTVMGGVLSVVTQIIIFPIYGLPAMSTTMHFHMTLIFMLVSWIKSYALRRAFDWWCA